MQHDIVEHSHNQFLTHIGSNAHSTRLVSKQRSEEKEEFPDRGLVSAMDGGEQTRRCRIMRGGDSFVVFTPRSVVALLH
jgi:hypothetical protein